ncbi:MAG: hypothetical protein AAB465_01530 [Patescibacteria group bacterium]
MSLVEIYKLQNDASQKVIVTCKLADDSSVVCEGDQQFIESLVREGVRDYSSQSDLKKLFPKDGIRFLEQLKYNLKSGYLMASDIKES